MNTVYTVIEAVTECVTAFFCAVSVDFDDGATAHILLVVDTVANAAFELGHDGFSFLVLWIFAVVFDRVHHYYLPLYCHYSECYRTSVRYYEKRHFSCKKRQKLHQKIHKKLLHFYRHTRIIKPIGGELW